MDLQTRKIAFVQEFLKLQSEETISQLENVLKTENQSSKESEVLDGVKQAVKEMNLIKAEKLEAKNAQDFIDELQG